MNSVARASQDVESAVRAGTTPSLGPRLVLGLIIAGVGIAAAPSLLLPTDLRVLNQASFALAEHRYQDAEGLACEILDRDPTSTRALLIAGEAAAGLLRSEDSLAYYLRVQDESGAEAVEAWRGIGIRAFRLRRVAVAERYLRRVLEADPTDLEAHSELAQLLLLVGRSWDALPHQFAVLEDGMFNGNRLVEAASIEFPGRVNHAFIQECLAAVPADPSPLLSWARVAVFRNERHNAEPMLRRLVAEAPRLLDAQAQLGRLLLDSSEFLEWRARLPADAEKHPEILVTFGLWAKQQGQMEAAVRCLGEALRMYPEHQTACHHMARALHAIGDQKTAEIFAGRAAKLQQMQSLFSAAADGEPIMHQIADGMEALGRRWEAAAWSYITNRYDAEIAWANENIERWTGSLDRRPKLTPAVANPAFSLDLSRFPLPNWQLASSAKPAMPQPNALATCRVSFVDRAADVGLNFMYYNGADPEQRRAFMFEYSGGGAAVLDFDADGWPDIYLTQGCPWPPQLDQTKYRDRLFRNLGNGRFEDVTEATGLGDNALSQGATVGDYDNDGFPDLYVSNIGGNIQSNKLYHNNGDGTFTDVTESSGTVVKLWGSSCVLADLDGDAFPDLYCVTYVAGPEAYDKICETDGRPVQCAPQSFRAEEDRVFLNLRDGRFRDVTKECGAAVPDGKGLGIVAADFDGTRRLSLFVSNDTVPNFYFVNQTEKPGAPLKLAESALYKGLAFDTKGRARSCMGVAVADISDDGLLDILVTNFLKESAYLFIQQPDRSFLESEHEAGLEQPTHEMLSWGAQFLDGELDGVLDLVIASGHLNDFRNRGIAYQMRPQYFQGLGGGRFAEAPCSSLGAHFQQERLGRAIARLDWNRDGLEDYCETHVDVPVSLVTNCTVEHGNFLAVQLRGTTSARDAIGTTIRLATGKKKWTRQLTAGDGFYASNERKLICGVGPASAIDELVIHWPSGLDQTFHNLEVNREVLFIEGATEPVYLPPP